MAIFLAIAIALTLAVLAIVLQPLWRARPLSAVAFVTSLAMLTGLLYWLIGTPSAFEPAQRMAAAESLDAAIARIEADLQQKPGQPEAWQLLGRAYAAQQQPTKARDAYARAARLDAGNADLQVEYAQSRALADPRRRFDAEAIALLERVLQGNPQHQRARWFLGIAQRQSGRAAEAARTWEPLLAQIDARTAASLRPQIDAARKDAGLPPLPAPPAPTDAATGANTVTVKVALDPDFAARVRLRGDASVFVIARIPGGPPMPVAVEKRSLQELPLTLTLDDADSPMPTRKLSALKEVEVIARLSASGNAMRQAGDVESAPVRVALPADALVELSIGNRSKP